MDEKPFDSINVIPLVDVMMVLLTIVLMTSTFIATGSLPLKLPRASHSATTAIKSLVIEIVLSVRPTKKHCGKTHHP